VKSNVKLRSNVFIRVNPDLRFDKPFQAQVRGRTALDRMLRKISAGTNEFAGVRYLNLSQRLEYCHDLRCDVCGNVPEGPVRQNGSISYEFRCLGRECRVNRFTVRHVDLNIQLVEGCAKAFRTDLHSIVQRALDRPVPSPLIPLDDETAIARSCVVKLTRNQGHVFKFHTLPELSEIINTALINLLQEGR
jgi:hypothetical protein